jgi:hypothetical protein
MRPADQDRRRSHPEVGLRSECSYQNGINTGYGLVFRSHLCCWLPHSPSVPEMSSFSVLEGRGVMHPGATPDGGLESSWRCGQGSRALRQSVASRMRFGARGSGESRRPVA